MIERTLAAAAFGNQPQSWPLPTATTPNQLWLRAVASGGQGRYGSAYRDLAVLRRSGSRRPVGLAGPQHAGIVPAPTRLARAGTGLGRSCPGAGRRRSRGPRRCPDRTGGRRAGRRPLRRRGDVVDASGLGAGARAVPDRLPVRRRWVAAELAMASGDGANRRPSCRGSRRAGAGHGHRRRRGTGSKARWCSPPRCVAQVPPTAPARSRRRRWTPPSGSD